MDKRYPLFLIEKMIRDMSAEQVTCNRKVLLIYNEKKEKDSPYKNGIIQNFDSTETIITYKQQ